MKKFLTFHTMVSPVVIQVLFWIGVVLCVVSAALNFYHLAVWRGALILILGPIFLRLSAEFSIILFRIHETLLKQQHARH